MIDPIKTIASLGLSTTSQNSAIQAIKYKTPFVNWSIDQFHQAVKTIVGEDVPQFTNIIQAKYTLMFLVQNLIIFEKRREVADPMDILSYSTTCFESFYAKNKIALELEEGGSIDDDDTPKQRKGTKSEMAYNIYLSLIHI